jgi:hypothetical protein
MKTETKTITTIVRDEEKNAGTRISRHVQFTLCGSCFWCASYLDGRGVEKCPSCESGKVESMPVAGNEMYTFDYGTLRGVTVRFVPSKPLA